MKSKICNTFFTKWFTSYYFIKEKFESKTTSILKVQIYHISNEIHIFYHTCLVDQFMELLRAKDRWNRSQSFICHRECIGTYKCSGIHNCQKAKLGFTAIHGADSGLWWWCWRQMRKKASALAAKVHLLLFSNYATYSTLLVHSSTLVLALSFMNVNIWLKRK